MTGLSLTPMSVQGLDIYHNPRDPLFDLICYVEYVQGRDIKRTVRTNELPAADVTRITKLMGLIELPGSWLDFIDRLALGLGLVDYDTVGIYRGYSSSERTFPDNYMTVSEQAHQAFLDLSPAAQEKALLELAIASHKDEHYFYPKNEFFQSGNLGRLDSFNNTGSATGVMENLDFYPIRQFLLKLLQACEPGVWYSTASLVAYLKANHPYFLIPKKIPPDRWKKVVLRYENFYEGPERWRLGKAVPDNAPDAFERVEGRYVERFLEGPPLDLRFVELAYSSQKPQTVFPSLGLLPAFRVTERFVRLMRDEVRPERVTVQPNFDLIIEAEIYPSRLMKSLSALAEEVSAQSGTVSVITMRLKKERVAAELVRQPQLDVCALLRQLTGRDLPANVKTELEEWSGHADQFVLYNGFSLLETSEPVPQARSYLAETIDERFSLVRNPAAFVPRLEEAALAPLWVTHDAAAFTRLPEALLTVFPRNAAPAPSAQAQAEPLPETIAVKRSIAITLYFAPNAEVFEVVRRALAEARCPIQADSVAYTIAYSQQHQARVDEVVQALSARYVLQFQDAAG